jgi:putative intracellular protease/amidase
MAGGHGIVYDGPNDKDLIAVVEKIWSEGGVVGSVCHGPAALVNVHAPNGEPIVKGRKVSLLCVVYSIYFMFCLISC